MLARSWLFIVLVLYIIYFAECIRFYLHPNTQKCLREEVRSNILIIGDYDVSEATDQRVDYLVTDSNGHIFSQREHITKGKFSFTSDAHDTFEICLTSRVNPQIRSVKHEVFLDIKTGTEAKNYEIAGESTKLKPMEIELKRLEELSDAIVQDFAEMKKREEEMRDTNESTTNRVFYLSIFSICLLLGLATWQILYLRKFFKSKKLIE